MQRLAQPLGSLILTMTRDQYLAHKRQQWNDALREGEERLATRRHERAEQEKIDPEFATVIASVSSQSECSRQLCRPSARVSQDGAGKNAHYELQTRGALPTIADVREPEPVNLQVESSASLAISLPNAKAMDGGGILHEIAHAIAGPEHHHDSTWQLICRAIGGSGERYHDMVLVEPKWALECVAGCWRRPCLRRSLLHRKPLCPECGSPCKYFPTRPD